MTRALYGYYRSSAAYRVRIALALKGLAYDYRAINLLPGVSEQRSAEYRALNPQGRVPFYADDQVGLSQSTAILEYLEELHPEPALLPETAQDRARVRQLVNVVACDIHPINNLSVLSYVKHTLGGGAEGVEAWIHHWIGSGFEALEALVAAEAGNYLFGNGVTMADLYLVPQMYNARRFGVRMDNFPTLVRIDAHLQTLEAFKAALPERQPDTPSDQRLD